ncbi:MAG: NAD+ synthase [Kineosporiaceae bacterium]
MRLALAQVNPTLGDVDGNVALVRSWAGRAAAARADLVAFPEMVLTGYPVEDMALRRSFIAASQQAVTRLARDLAADGHGALTVVVGYLDVGVDVAEDVSLVGRPAGPVQNCAAVLRDGEVVARYAKRHLPNYGVFDEYRIFVPGTSRCPVTVPGHGGVELTICEDIWRDRLVDSLAEALAGEAGGPGQPTGHAAGHATDPAALLVVNGSPYEHQKDDVRLALCADRARRIGRPVAYVNLVGGQDDLVFDGGSLVVAPDGTVLARAPQFVEHLLLVDLPTGDLPAGDAAGPGTAHLARPLDDTAEVWHALVLGLRDYARKNGFDRCVLGLSGGIDSAVTAALAVDALGPDGVLCVSLPSRYSSGHSLADAAELTRRTGAAYRVVPIQDMVDAFVGPLDLTGIAEENVQARVRGVVLMGISNSEGRLVLAPGNKSELATGYSTIYGDAVGGFAPIKDVSKTLVWELARWRNAEARRRGEPEPVPVNSIEKAPSAELRPGQRDADSLPPYEVLDAVIDGYVTGDRGHGELLADGFDEALVDRVVRMVDGAEWKRRQYPIGTKITTKAFGRDRRLPITNRWQEQPDESATAAAGLSRTPVRRPR